ncbi:cytochrome P450 [Glonium stellatum]|uniref:Cytochrome P450 n=1 Tax=Glonium stellatum TaxID=574774 RepID=A0A8E2EXB0_9PEZI|nr:cytochrome P450 [Glonium stellatum]
MDAIYFYIPLALLALVAARATLRSPLEKEFQKIQIPWINALSLSNPVAQLVKEGYQKFNKLQKPFLISYWAHDYLVLPLKYLTDIRLADKAHLSVNHAISDVFFLWSWNKDLFQGGRLPMMVTKGLNPNLVKATDMLMSEANYSFNTELGDGKGPVPAMVMIQNLTFRTVNPVIFGKELARNDEMLKAAQSLFTWNFLNGLMLLKLPLGPFRDIVGWPLYHLQRRRLRTITNIMAPVIDKRLQERGLGTQDKATVDGISCTLDLLDEYPLNQSSPPSYQIGNELMQNYQAATLNPASIITQMIFQILEQPKYLDPLRKEAEQAIARHGWSEKIINELRLQDSFIRETGRVYPLASLQAQRQVMGKPFTFSDGLTLPTGTRLAFPTAGQHDPDISGATLNFDGFRYAQLAEAEKDSEDGVNVSSAVHADPSYLSFGYGNHICPGRFLGVRTVKIIFTKLILEYDITWDYEGLGQPARFEIEGFTLPNVNQRASFQKRNLT